MLFSSIKEQYRISNKDAYIYKQVLNNLLISYKNNIKIINKQ